MYYKLAYFPKISMSTNMSETQSSLSGMKYKLAPWHCRCMGAQLMVTVST